ncbi:MAG: hypothetical protein J6U28_01365 [Bacteroidales bacterium]|nr:hypothetical protein [Bacteroidales bacterium]
MNKTGLIWALSVIALLVGVIAGAVFFLYSGNGDERKEEGEQSVTVDLNAAVSAYPICPAVPSDAAMLVCFNSMDEGIDLLTDSTSIFGTLMCGTGKRGIQDFLRILDSGRHPSGYMAVSLHYSGDLVPLIAVSSQNDSPETVYSFITAADSARLYSAIVEKDETSELLGNKAILLASPSETIVDAARRHISNGTSVLDKQGFPDVAVKAGGTDAFFVSSDYLGKLFGSFFTKEMQHASTFFTTLADWTCFTLDGRNERRSRMNAVASYTNNPAYFLNVPSPGETGVAGLLPSNTVFFMDVPVSEWYFNAYHRYMDAHKLLGKYHSDNYGHKTAMGISSDAWLKRLDIREVAKAVLPDGSAMLLIRPGKEDSDIILRNTGVSSMREYKTSVLPYVWKGFVKSEVGDFMTIQDESHFVWYKGWMIIGKAETLQGYVDGSMTGETLKASLGANGIRLADKSGLTVFWKVGELSDILFRPKLASSFKQTVSSVAMESAVLVLNNGRATINIERIPVMKTADNTVISRDTLVTVPAGPFKVKNCATGRINLFGQAPNKSLTLKEENGTTLWSVPFSKPICGAAEAIDYYANGKLQFLFAAGSKLYLIDRLGRFVKGFPCELGKEVLLGPSVYDFTGANGYTVMILHKDNSIGMYDLHGQLRSGWQGISVEGETIKKLPELLEVNGIRYWVVRTSECTRIYSFEGGEQLTHGSGDKRIRPDAIIEISAKGTLSAVCLDGKTRNIR